MDEKIGVDAAENEPDKDLYPEIGAALPYRVASAREGVDEPLGLAAQLAVRLAAKLVVRLAVQLSDGPALKAFDSRAHNGNTPKYKEFQ